MKIYENIFDGNLGAWKGKPYYLPMNEDVDIYHAQASPVHKNHERTLKTEIYHLVKLLFLRKINLSQWGAPTFIIPKKDGTVRFISDFRSFNKEICRQPYPITKIQELLL